MRGFTLAEMLYHAQQVIASGSQITRDNLDCFLAFYTPTHVHAHHISGGGHESVDNPELNSTLCSEISKIRSPVPTTPYVSSTLHGLAGFE